MPYLCFSKSMTMVWLGVVISCYFYCYFLLIFWKKNLPSGFFNLSTCYVSQCHSFCLSCSFCLVPLLPTGPPSATPFLAPRWRPVNTHLSPHTGVSSSQDGAALPYESELLKEDCPRAQVSTPHWRNARQGCNLLRCPALLLRKGQLPAILEMSTLPRISVHRTLAHRLPTMPCFYSEESESSWGRDSLQCKHVEPHLLAVSIHSSQSSLLLGLSALNYPRLQFCSPSHLHHVRVGP